MHRILPDYRELQIDCVIVVHSPEGTRFFLENGADHSYRELPSTEFLASLNQASDSMSRVSGSASTSP